MAIRTISLDLDAHLPISPQKLRAHQSNDVENIRIIKIGLSRSSCGARAPLTRLISGISWIETQEGVVDLRRNRDWDFAKTKKGGFSLSDFTRSDGVGLVHVCRLPGDSCNDTLSPLCMFRKEGRIAIPDVVGRYWRFSKHCGRSAYLGRYRSSQVRPCAYFLMGSAHLRKSRLLGCAQTNARRCTYRTHTAFSKNGPSLRNLLIALRSESETKKQTDRHARGLGNT